MSNISKVRVSLVKEPKVNKDGNLSKVKALATLLLNENFAINKIKIIEGVNGLFVSFPQIKNSKNEYEDVAHPTTSDFRKETDAAILEEYAKVLSASAPASTPVSTPAKDVSQLVSEEAHDFNRGMNCV